LHNHFSGAHVGNALTALNQNVGWKNFFGRFPEEEDLQNFLSSVVADVDKVQPEKWRGTDIGAAPIFLAAEIGVPVHCAGLRNVCVWPCWVCLTMYFTVTLSVASCAVTSRSCRSIKSPRYLCRAACSVN